MNAFLRKEIRLLRPSFLIGAIAALSIWTLPLRHKDTFWMVLRTIVPFVVCPAMVIMLALESFGAEMSARTFSQLLAQSISRQRLWWTKVSLLAGAVLTIWVIWYFSLTALSKMEGVRYFPWAGNDWPIQSLFFLFVVFSGGLWSVLLFRQVGIAFWATILVPLALFVVTYSLVDDWGPHRANVFVAILFVLYGIGGFFFAQWLFLRAQDVQWLSGVIAIPKWRSIPRVREDAPAVRRYRPRRAVIKREFQLQQSQLIIAVFLCVLHLAAVAARNLIPGLRGHEILQALVHVFWVLWLLMPLLIGGGAIAEERKLGTLGGQLCTPVSNRFQFFTKLGVVVFLSVLFGVLMPTVLESLDGTRMFGNAHAVTDGLLPDFKHIMLWYWVQLTPIAVISGVVAFYFSSLCRNTLQALGPSVLGIVVVGVVLAMSVLPEQTIGYPLWQGFIGDLIGIPVVGGVGLWLAYMNYRSFQRGLALWNRNLGALLAALVLSAGSATGLYHRAWERLLPMEEKHGPARLDGAARPELQRQMGSLEVTLANGKVWRGNFGYFIASRIQVLTSDWTIAELSGGSRFLNGADWASVADCVHDTVAIRKDGTLWISRKPLPVVASRVFNQNLDHQAPQTGQTPGSVAPAFEKYGEASDWKSVVATRNFALLLKQNGTLWTWSGREIAWTNWPGLAALPLKQVGSDSDWAEMRKVSSRCFYLRKKDGRVWSNVSGVSTTDFVVSLEGAAQRAPFLDGRDWLGLAMVDFPSQDPTRQALPAAGVFNRYVVGVRDDGTFRLMAGVVAGPRPDVVNRDVQLNPGTNWIGLEAVESGEVALLKSDGSLWRWNLPQEDRSDHPGFTRVGAQSDWLAMASDGGALFALSADGSIWAWRQNPPWNWSPGGLYVAPLIEVSRRAQFVANIFGR